MQAHLFSIIAVDYPTPNSIHFGSFSFNFVYRLNRIDVNVMFLGQFYVKSVIGLDYHLVQYLCCSLDNASLLRQFKFVFFHCFFSPGSDYSFYDLSCSWMIFLCVRFY